MSDHVLANHPDVGLAGFSLVNESAHSAEGLFCALDKGSVSTSVTDQD